MDPVTMGFVASAASAGFTGLAGQQAAKAEQKRAEVNSYIGRTRALQSDTVSRQAMEDDLASARTAFSASGMPAGVGTIEVINELRRVKDRERRIGTGSLNAQAADYRMQAQNAGARGSAALIGGLIKAGPSLFDLYEHRTS